MAAMSIPQVKAKVANSRSSRSRTVLTEIALNEASTATRPRLLQQFKCSDSSSTRAKKRKILHKILNCKARANKSYRSHCARRRLLSSA